jgi:hypothetical protein
MEIYLLASCSNNGLGYLYIPPGLRFISEY